MSDEQNPSAEIPLCLLHAEDFTSAESAPDDFCRNMTSPALPNMITLFSMWLWLMCGVLGHSVVNLFLVFHLL